jgi:hypothetical protein
MVHRRIHQILKAHHPEAVRKAKRIFAFKYPKLFLLVLMIVLSYFIFSNSSVDMWVDESLEQFKYFGTFVGGFLTAFGFTAPLGFGLLIDLNISNIWIGTILGGIGAMVGDIVIFKTIKFSFMDEFEQLEKTGAIKKIREIVKKNKHVLISHYLLYIFAGIMIATPLPDEIGVSMLAGLTTIKPFKLMIISFLLHASAVFIFLIL